VSQLSLAWSAAEARGDWQLLPHGLATGTPLASAMLVSLFTDRRASDDDQVPAGMDRGGWWGDAYSPSPWGSRLWLLRRAKVATGSREPLRRAEEYAQEALAWLVDDGVAASVVCSAFWQGRRLGMTVTVNQRDGATTALTFAALWDAETGPAQT